MVPAPSNGPSDDDPTESSEAGRDEVERKVARGDFAGLSVPVRGLIDRRDVEELRTTVEDLRLWLDWWDDQWERRARESRWRAYATAALLFSLSTVLTLASAQFRPFLFGSAKAWETVFTGLAFLSFGLAVLFGWVGVVSAAVGAVQRARHRRHRAKAEEPFDHPETRLELIDALRAKLPPPD